MKAEKKTPAFYRKAMEEYVKRLGAYTKICCYFIKKQREWDNKRVDDDAVMCLDIIAGKGSISSESFSKAIESWEMSGKKTIRIFAGGMQKEGGDYDTICLSEYDLPPAMQGMIMTEQIYRGYRIRYHQPYHK